MILRLHKHAVRWSSLPATQNVSQHELQVNPNLTIPPKSLSIFKEQNSRAVETVKIQAKSPYFKDDFDLKSSDFQYVAKDEGGEDSSRHNENLENSVLPFQENPLKLAENLYLAKLEKVNFPAIPRPAKNSIINPDKFNFDMFRVQNVNSLAELGNFKARKKFNSISLKREIKEKTFNTLQARSNISGYFLANTPIIDEMILKKVRFDDHQFHNCVYLHEDLAGKMPESSSGYSSQKKSKIGQHKNKKIENQRLNLHENAYLRLIYVSLRSILSEIYARDRNFVPENLEFLLEKNENSAVVKSSHALYADLEAKMVLTINQAIKNTFMFKLKDRKKLIENTAISTHANLVFNPDKTVEDFMSFSDKKYVYTEFDEKRRIAGQILVFPYPSEVISQEERLEIYEKYLRAFEDKSGYLVLVDFPENAHILQEARAFILSKGEFYERASDELPEAFTFAPCPHDKPCPLRELSKFV